MGMFDYVIYEEKCPTCKKRLNDFQSKDKSCSMSQLNFWEVDNFYDKCSRCLTWVEYTLIKRPNRKLTIKDYEKTIRIASKKEIKEKELGE